MGESSSTKLYSGHAASLLKYTHRSTRSSGTLNLYRIAEITNLSLVIYPYTHTRTRAGFGTLLYGINARGFYKIKYKTEIRDWKELEFTLSLSCNKRGLQLGVARHCNVTPGPYSPALSRKLTHTHQLRSTRQPEPNYDIYILIGESLILSGSHRSATSSSRFSELPFLEGGGRRVVFLAFRRVVARLELL